MAKSYSNEYSIWWCCKWIYLQENFYRLFSFRWIFKQVPCGNRHHQSHRWIIILLLLLTDHRYVWIKSRIIWTINSCSKWTSLVSVINLQIHLLLNHPMVLHFLINSKSTIHLVIFNQYICISIHNVQCFFSI